MHHRAVAGLGVFAILLLAACSSSAATSAPAQATSASSGAGAVACAESATTGQVADAIKDFAFGPKDIQVKVGQVVTFTNGDLVGHTATLDDGSCSTGTIQPGTSDGLLFSVAGTYPFHCKIHPNMTGTITVS